jgi:transposase InsO family protein
MDRATVRRWAMTQGLAHHSKAKAARKPVRRWQVQQIGQLWQYDASPHRWFAGRSQIFPLLQIIDDHSRLLPLAKLYARETLLSHLDFLSGAFNACGLPLALYVDYHSFFFTHVPEALTQLGASLRFYEVSLRYAPTPQAKGKIERAHDFWQKRLPALFAAEHVFNLPEANRLLDQVRLHHNTHERHREIGSTPKAAWNLALREKRSALRPVPACPWWSYVWSQRSPAKVDSDGRIAIGTQRLRIDKPPGSKVIRCLHPNGDYSVLAAAPQHGQRPVLLLHSPSPKPVPL